MIKYISKWACIFAFSISAAHADNVWVIHAGGLLVIPWEAPLTKQTIVIRNDVIERIEDGYYLSKYDATLEILVDENENYFAHLSQGVLSQTSEIIPCS